MRLKKKILVSFLFAGVVLSGYSQNDSSFVKKPAKSVVQYFGLQANQLFRQIFNLSNSNSTIDNPYLLVYSVNSAKTGSGLNIGLGYSFIQTNDGDALIKREATTDRLAFRIGYEKKSRLAKRWLVSAGADLVIDSEKNSSKTTNDTDFNKSSIKTNSKINGWGLGPRLTLSFFVNDRILIGTETNYYLKFSKDKLTVDSSVSQQEFDPNTGGTHWVTHTDHSDDSAKTKKFQLSIPAVLFLIIKF